jgi:hypothetical protein
VFVNSAWAVNFMPVWSMPFWELEPDIWRATLDTLSTYWFSSAYARG